MNKKWNKKKWYAIIFFALSAISSLSRPLWIMAVKNNALANNFDFFIYKTFGWPLLASVEIAFFGPFILGAILLLFAIYFEKTSSGEKNDTFSIIRAFFAFLVILFFLYMLSMILDFGA